MGYRKGLRKKANGGKWIVRKLVDDRYVKKVLGVADDYKDANGADVLDYKQALTLANDFEDNAPSRYTVNEAMEDYLASYKTRAKAYRATEQSAACHILPKLGDKLISELTTRDITRWHHALAEASIIRRGKKVIFDPSDREAVRKRQATANRIMTILKAALNHAYEASMAKSDDAWRRAKPFKKVDAPKIQYLKEGECQRFLNACSGDFRRLAKAALLTGCRYGDLTRARVEDFNADTGVLFVPDPKQRKPYHVPLTDEGSDCFIEWTTGKHRGDMIFTRATGEAWGKSQQYRRMNDACRIAEIDPPISFHVLRHTYGSILAMRAVPLHVISELLGHADTRITKRHYAHLQPGYVADIVRKHLPRFDPPQPSKITPIR